MLINGDDRMSRISSCLPTADKYLLSRQEATDIVRRQKAVIEERWVQLCDEAELTQTDRNLLWHRAFLNPYSIEE